MTQVAATAPQSASAASRWRHFLAIDEREAIIAFAQTAYGRGLIALLVLLAVWPHFGGWASIVAVAAAMAASLKTAWRNQILCAATWLTAFAATWLGENDTADNIASVLAQEQLPQLSAALLATGFLALLVVIASPMFYWIRSAPQSLLAKRPLVTLLLLETAACLVANLDVMQGRPRAALWSAIFVFTPYLWFLPYAIVDQRSRTPSPMLFQMAILRPFWSPSYLSFNKGAAFLNKHLAKTPNDLAVTQLKAVKLLLPANVLYAIRRTLGFIFGEQLTIPAVGEAIDALSAGHPYPALIGWTVIIVSTAKLSLQIALWAHLFVGIARLAGYRLPRGSWRPLGSRTLMDYFNRFHYYFKEFLVDFFFVPTFFKVFRGHPRLRMFFATFMAAGVGNALWHFFRDIDLIATQGMAAALASYTSYAFYCVVLATGVGLSQVRANLGKRSSATMIGRVYSFFFVWSFVVCMHIFSDGSRNHPLGERLSFLASLFGVY